MDDDECKTDIPREISKHVSEWKRFGRFLRINDGRLNQIEFEHSKCCDRVYTIMTEFCFPEPINNSWSFWKKKLSQYPEGHKIIREIEITIPDVINEAADSTCHLGICQNNGLLFHYHMSIEKDKPFPMSSDKQIAVNIGGGGITLPYYQDYEKFMKTRSDYFKLYEMFSDFKTFDFTTSDQKKCSILNSIRCFLEQSQCNGFAYKGYSLRNHYTLFGEYVVPQEEVNNNILAYFSNDNVLIHIKTCDNIKDISRALNSFLEDVQFAQAVHECVFNSLVIHIGVVVVEDNILKNNNVFVCYQCMKRCLILPKITFSTAGGFNDWYDNVIKSNESFEQMKNSLNSINQSLKTDISTELKRNIISQKALKSFDFPSFTPLPDYQMKELEKLVLLTADQIEILHSPHKHIMIKGSYGSGKSLVLQQRFKQTVQESSDNDIFYLICHDQMSQFAKRMKLMSKRNPDKLILVCNSLEISDNEIMNISDLLKSIRVTWKSRCVHVYIDEFNGEYLDEDEVHNIKEEMKYFKNSHIVITVQSMEYTFYKKSNLDFIEKDGIGFQFKMLAKETSFFVYQLEYSLRCSVEINTFVNAMTNYLRDGYLKYVKTQIGYVSSTGRPLPFLDREFTLEMLRNTKKSDTYYKCCYNTATQFGHNVSSGKVKVYSPDQGLESNNCVNIILYHLLTCIEEKVVVSTFDNDISIEVQSVFRNSKFNWTRDIEEFATKNSSFQVLLTDYASMRGFEFPNVIFLLGSACKFLKFRLIECFTRATTNLSLVFKFSCHELLGFLNNRKNSNFVEYKVLYFDHLEEIYYFQSSDESKKEILQRNISEECVFFHSYDSEGERYWSHMVEIVDTDELTSDVDVNMDLELTFEIIFKQDNVKLFEDLVYLHSIDVSKYRTFRRKFIFEENLLHLAAKYNASKLCTLICNQYKELDNSHDYFEYTPLQVAAKYNSDLVATVLIKHGAQVNITSTSSKVTPLHVAAKYNSDKVASILLDNAADVNGFDFQHQTPTPLFIAGKNNSKNTAIILLERGADVNIQDKYGQSVLHETHSQSDSDVLLILLDHGANVNCQDCEGNTPLHCAVRRDNYYETKLLLERGADVNIQNDESEMPLHFASQYDSKNTAIVLLEHGADVNIKDKYGQSVDHGADINCLDYKGNTPLHIAVQYDNYYISKLLLERGADVNIQNNRSQTPLDVALEYECDKLVHILLLSPD